jgi:hypothetical protein
MSRYVLTIPAKQDLKEISRYIIRFKQQCKLNCWLIFLIWDKVAMILQMVCEVSP